MEDEFENHYPVNNFAPKITKSCVMWEGQALPRDTKFGNCRDKIVDSRAFLTWWIKLIWVDKTGARMLIMLWVYEYCRDVPFRARLNMFSTDKTQGIVSKNIVAVYGFPS